MNLFGLTHFQINPISARDGWRLCDFIASNIDYIKRYFPITVASNITPDLSNTFVQQKISEFTTGQEFLFTLKELVHRNIIGLIYVKEIDRIEKEAEMTYCIGYPYKNKGFATLAIKTHSQWAMEHQSLQHLRIIVHNSNISSIRVAENCGYLWKETLPEEHIPTW
jgi:ribosomal-protein-alanine N-acetyltransferase